MASSGQNDGDTYASILRTVWLFLKNNGLRGTAERFAEEVAEHMDTVVMEGVAPRTVILRPLELDNTVNATVSDENIIICISGKQDINIGYTTNSRFVVADPPPCDCSEGTPDTSNDSPVYQCSEDTVAISRKCVNDGTGNPNYQCNEDVAAVSRFCSSGKDLGWLKENLQRLQKDHVRLIEVATQMIGALHEIEGEQKEEVLDKYKQALSNLWMYASCTKNPPPQVDTERGESPKKSPASSNEAVLEVLLDIATISETPHKSETEVGKSSSTTTPDRGVDDPVASIEPLQIANVEDVKVAVEEEVVPETNVAEEKAPKRRESGSKSSTTSPTRVEKKPLRSLPATPAKSGSKGSQMAVRRSPTKKRMSVKPTKKSPHRESSKTSEVIEEQETESLFANDAFIRKELENNIAVITAKTCPEKGSRESLYQLDFDLVKRHLIESDVDTKLRLLQALRWRLTRSEPKARDHNLVSFITHDILHIHKLGAAFLDSYLCPNGATTPHPIQEEMARFLNTLASLAVGREYLEKTPAITQLLVMLMMDRFDGMKMDDLTRQFLMATIQKLSLNGNIREMIISIGGVKWLVGYLLDNHAKMTNYEAEYSIALLTNLCIHNETRLKCERMPDMVVDLLSVLVETPHSCCQPYLPSILGSLLINPVINRKAQGIGLGKKMQGLIERADNGGMKNQLEVILSMHQAGEEAECSCEISDDSRIYVDYLEPELDLHESVYGDCSGEAFLEKYCILFVNPEKQIHTVRKTCVCTSSNKIMEAARRPDPEPFDLQPVAEEETAGDEEPHSSTAKVAEKVEEEEEEVASKEVIGVVLKSAKDVKTPENPKSRTNECVTCSKSTSVEQNLGGDKGIQVDTDTTNVTKANSTSVEMFNDSSSTGEYQEPQAVSSETSGGSTRRATVSAFKRMFNQVEYSSTCPPMIIPCRLNYYYYNRTLPHFHNAIPVCVPVTPVVNGKYSCACYETIKSTLGEDQKHFKSGGKKNDNVVYGPLTVPTSCRCRMSCESCKKNANVSDAFQSRPKINRTP